jgi:tetratricopeptide (TPR) repeat protein
MRQTSLLTRSIAVVTISCLSAAPIWATCGGGGGGGTGGMGASGQGEQVYFVPWKVAGKDAAPSEGLVLYWFPATANELKISPLLTSRALSLYAGQCVAMQVADPSSPLGRQMDTGRELPVTVLATARGEVVGRVQSQGGKLKVGEVEKLVQGEVKKREDAVEQQSKDARLKSKSGDNGAAVELWKSVLGEKCLFPKKAKDAVKELKKLGQTVSTEVTDGWLGPEPVFAAAESARVEAKMRAGLRAENAEDYVKARRLYAEAAALDPADPAPLRYLGEVYRHHTGEWAKARETFDKILAMRADPLSRAVAMHGLGKMTIHEGAFAKGLELFEESVKEFPLALTYRNLAVYWNSEHDPVKTAKYVELALALDPVDPYNRVFSAVFMAQAGRTAEAVKIARENEGLLPASYNLAAIHALAGEREKALALLKRHFYSYERYDAVRSKEMMEARVDAVFDSLRQDADFTALTAGADGMLALPMH